MRRPADQLEKIGITAITPQRVFTEATWEDLTQGLNLSPQLKRVAFCIVCGMDDKNVAGEMAIGISTVRSHLARLYSALKVEDRSGVMIFFFRRMRQLRAAQDGASGEMPAPAV